MSGEATVLLLEAVITAFPCVSLPFLAVTLLSQPTVAIRAEGEDQIDAFCLGVLNGRSNGVGDCLS
eukprot:SAG22_NODE_746_length_7496_cov_5.066513_4_plen_66_part_00